MKLLIITVVKEFEPALKKILFASGINEFSTLNVTGCRDESADNIGQNWFASEINETASVLFWVFASVAQVEQVFTAVQEFNKEQESLSRAHLSILPIEKII